MAEELRQSFALANAFKEGDLAVGGTRDDQIRAEARRLLLQTTLGTIRRTTFVDDGVSAAIARTRASHLDADLDALTVERVKGILLGPQGVSWMRTYADALTSESIAALAKVMTNDELSSVARSLFNPLGEGPVAIGSPTHFGSRIQPNSPGDTEREILFSILEGLSYGCGDVVIGLNPASDDVDTIIRLEQLLEQVVRRLELPTRFCVLSDLVKQHRALQRTRIDVAFQSLAGTSRALIGMVGLDVDGVRDLARSFDALYFETGQGSEVTNESAEGVDMVTLEARTYGVARHLRAEIGTTGRPPWMIVNDVAGFIGPEVFRTAAQLERACLEDTVMAKLHGLTMGLDVCATFHMGIAPQELHRVTASIVEHAAPAYLMAVAGNADPMLGYLTTSFRQHPGLRRQVGRRVSSRMERRLSAIGASDANGDSTPGVETVGRLYAAYARNGGDRRSLSSLEDEGARELRSLRDAGFDLGIGNSATAQTRLDHLYIHARHALYASVKDAVIADACPRHVIVQTLATSRDEYLAHPASGEELREDDARTLARLYPARNPQVQLVISDGLNADAINEHLRALLPQLRRLLAAGGCHVGGTDVIVRNGRVRAGYGIGGLTGAAIIVHVIGERPGTGINMASAYITYGRDESGQSRWSRTLDHSATTAVCGMHPQGKTIDDAAREIAGVVRRMIDQRTSGIALRT
jgi:ethanolamine ammonia-lyase large subunit